MNVTIKLSKKDDFQQREKKLNFGIKTYSLKLCNFARERCKEEERACINDEYSRIFIERPMKEMLEGFDNGTFTFEVTDESVENVIKEAVNYSRSK